VAIGIGCYVSILTDPLVGGDHLWWCGSRRAGKRVECDLPNTILLWEMLFANHQRYRLLQYARTTAQLFVFGGRAAFGTASIGRVSSPYGLAT